MRLSNLESYRIWKSKQAPKANVAIEFSTVAYAIISAKFIERFFLHSYFSYIILIVIKHRGQLLIGHSILHAI